jgi:hypothetical protein
MDAIFKFSGLLVLPFWGLMILLPRWRFQRNDLHVGGTKPNAQPRSRYAARRS